MRFGGDWAPQFDNMTNNAKGVATMTQNQFHVLLMEVLKLQKLTVRLITVNLSTALQPYRVQYFCFRYLVFGDIDGESARMKVK